MHENATPAQDADAARESGHNTGVSGTRYSVIENPEPQTPAASAAIDAQGARMRYADSGEDGYEPTAGFETPTAFDDPADSGLAILPGVAAAEVSADDAPTEPIPALNQPVAGPPRPVGDAGRPPGEFGTGYGGNTPVAANGGQPKRVRDLALDQRMRIWRWRALIMLVIGVALALAVSWYVGLTLAILAGIVHTVYASRTVASIPTGGSTSRAQRQTRRQLAAMRRSGYQTLNARPIPDSQEFIDHLVVGPTGVYAIDSEKWHKDLPIRTRNGKQLWHGPQSMKPRLEHARWEAQQASKRLSDALGREVVVRPAMAVYGPKVPWDIATIREVDVFSGPRLRKYLRRRARMKELPQLTAEDVHKIFEAAGAVLPGVAPARPDVPPTKTATPVG